MARNTVITASGVLFASLLLGCGSGPSPSKPRVAQVGKTTIEGPIRSGGGVPRIGVAPFNGEEVGYAQSEYFISGTASAYTSKERLTVDGKWAVIPGRPAAYKTRIVVRMPRHSSQFNGTVYVEWLNVSSGFDLAPGFTMAGVQMVRSHSIWVGVSAQSAGVEGGGDAFGAAFVLKKVDPVRYGSLHHPGDTYSYDIFSQVGATVWRDGKTLFGAMVPARVIAIGESQSAERLTTYIDALATYQDVYSGYLVHSRPSRGAALSAAPLPDVAVPDGTLIRTDLQRPVLTFSTETDLAGGSGLGYRRAEQSDTNWFRSWEVAGTAHADAYALGLGDSDDGSGAADAALFAAMLKPPSSFYDGLIKCDGPINAGPQTYVLRSAFSALESWVSTGTPPSSMPRLATNAALTDYQRDSNGNAMGGIRTPHVDVPVARLQGLGQAGNWFCDLLGVTRAFGPAQLSSMYSTKDDFIARWNAATDAAVKRGAILDVDAVNIKKAAVQTYVQPPSRR